MPFFKTTKNILFCPWEDELFDENWMDSDKLMLPPSKKWNYSKELKIEDVEVWEVICESGGGFGVYASWNPYAEFYLVMENYIVETYYGPGSQKNIIEKMKKFDVPIPKNEVWVEKEDLWLYL